MICVRCRLIKDDDLFGWVDMPTGRHDKVCKECRATEHKVSYANPRYMTRQKGDSGLFLDSEVDLWWRPETVPTVREALAAIDSTLIGRRGYSRINVNLPLEFALQIYRTEVLGMIGNRCYAVRCEMDDELPMTLAKWNIARNILVDCMGSQDFEKELVDDILDRNHPRGQAGAEQHHDRLAVPA